MFDFLSPRQPIERSFLRIPRISGIICGFWPQQRRSCFTVLRFLLNIFAVALGAVSVNLYGFVYSGTDLNAALEAFCPGVTILISLLKMWLFFVNYKDWHHMTTQLRDMLMKDICPAKRRIIEHLAAVSGTLSFVLLVSGSATNTFFSLCPLLMNIYRRWLNAEEVVKVLPFNAIVPEVFVNNPLLYRLTYGILTLSGAMTVFTFSAVDGLFVCVYMYVSGLFRMLQHDIRQAFAELQASEEFASVEQNLKFRRRLANIVERHNSIIDLCSKFTSQFTPVVLMHFLSAALVLCFSILNLMLNVASLKALIYIFYSIAALMELFLYCRAPTTLVKATDVANTLYNIEWYKCDVKTRKYILMMLRRSQKAQTIAVPFFEPSLPTFTTIISTAVSYITMLKTFL